MFFNPASSWTGTSETSTWQRDRPPRATWSSSTTYLRPSATCPQTSPIYAKPGREARPGWQSSSLRQAPIHSAGSESCATWVSPRWHSINFSGQAS